MGESGGFGRSAHLIEAYIEVDGLELLVAGELFRWIDEEMSVKHVRRRRDCRSAKQRM